MRPVHGGDHLRFYETYGQVPLDFSVNVNPMGMSQKAPKVLRKTADQWVYYPDIKYRRLRQAVGDFYRIPPEFILPGNGASDLIWRAGAMLRGGLALLTAPTFSEYECALSAFGCAIRRHFLKPENRFALTERILDEITPDLDALFLCNPNNPTGRTADPALLRLVLERCRENQVILWVDECFNGFLEEPKTHSLTESLFRYDNLVILQAATKLYALAGLRLGYAFCGGGKLRESLAGYGQSWPVSTIAQEAGIASMEDEEYLLRSLALIAGERERMRKALESAGLEVLGGEANYLFFRTSVPSFGTRMGEQGILLRDCGSYSGLGDGYYRMALRMPRDNDRFCEALWRITGKMAKYEESM